MGRRRLYTQPSLFHIGIYAVSTVSIAALFFLAVPVWAAVTAGIAAISIVLFGGALLLLLALLATADDSVRRYLLLGIAAATTGLVVPQAAYLNVAHNRQLSLSFDPVRYVSFRGDTDIQPDSLIPYKTVGSQRLELAHYESSYDGIRPAVILLHGGGWRYGSHLETGVWPQLLTQAGYHVFSVEYRLSGDDRHTWKDAPDDVADSILFLKGAAKKYSVDSSRLTLMGQSAGGHLALLEAYRNEQVEAVIGLYPPTDPVLDYRTSRDKSAELDFIGGPPSQYPNRYQALSPKNYLDTTEPRTLLVQGITDDLVSQQNAKSLLKDLRAHQLTHDSLILPLTGHSFENQRGGFATQLTEQMVLRFLDQ